MTMRQTTKQQKEGKDQANIAGSAPIYDGSEASWHSTADVVIRSAALREETLPDASGNRRNPGIRATGFPVIDVHATGENIRRLRVARDISNRELATYFGFNNVQTVYKWQRGTCLPTVENLFALAKLLDVTIDEILVADEPVHDPAGSAGVGEGCRQLYGEDTEDMRVYLRVGSRIYLVPGRRLPDPAVRTVPS